MKVHVNGVGVVENYEEYSSDLWELLPPWVARKAEEGCFLEYLAQMPTKDGRRCGNGIVVGVDVEKDTTVYVIRTESGNTIKASYHEAMELFHPPKYIKTEEAYLQMEKVWDIYEEDVL